MSFGVALEQERIIVGIMCEWTQVSDDDDDGPLPLLDDKDGDENPDPRMPEPTTKITSGQLYFKILKKVIGRKDWYILALMDKHEVVDKLTFPEAVHVFWKLYRISDVKELMFSHVAGPNSDRVAEMFDYKKPWATFVNVC